MLDLYRNIKNRRLELDMSQQTLAEKVGYSGKSMISKVEKGEVDLTTTMINKFADALHTTSSALMGWDEIDWNPKTQEISDYALDSEETLIIEAWRNSDDTQKEMIRRILAYSDKLSNKKGGFKNDMSKM